MDILTKTDSFLKDYGMSVADIDADRVCKSIISEMELGLKGEKSSLEMLPTYVDVPQQIPTLEPVADAVAELANRGTPSDPDRRTGSGCVRGRSSGSDRYERCSEMSCPYT